MRFFDLFSVIFMLVVNIANCLHCSFVVVFASTSLVVSSRRLPLTRSIARSLYVLKSIFVFVLLFVHECNDFLILLFHRSNRSSSKYRASHLAHSSASATLFRHLHRRRRRMIASSLTKSLSTGILFVVKR